MRKPIEIIALSEILIFYGFILKDKNSICMFLFFVFLAALLITVLLSKAKRLYCLAGIIAALLALSVFYSENAKLKTLVPLNQAECLYCEIDSSPEKLNDAYYSIKVKALAVNSRSLAGSAKGKTAVIIKASCLQKQNNVLFDKGLCLFFSGRFSDNAEKFIADSAFLCSPDVCIKAYRNRLFEFRAFIRQRLKQILRSFSKAGKLLAAVIIGSREYLDDSVKILFRKAGLSHILALSGFHLSVICLFAQKTADFFKKKRRNLFLVLVSSAFVFMAGSQPSLVRALIFICIKSLCSFFKIKCKNSAVFYLSLCVHIVLQPAAAFSPSFLLSYSAVYGIIFLSQKILKMTDLFFPEKLKKFKELFAVSAGAQIGAVPVQFFMLNSFSLMGIISSVFAVPLFSIFVISGIFAILFAVLIPESISFFNVILTFLYDIIAVLVQFFSRL